VLIPNLIFDAEPSDSLLSPSPLRAVVPLYPFSPPDFADSLCGGSLLPSTFLFERVECPPVPHTALDPFPLSRPSHCSLFTLTRTDNFRAAPYATSLLLAIPVFYRLFSLF